MPVTNENLSAALIGNILANGYTPRTPEEWIMSALNYLDQEAVVPPIGGGGGGGLSPNGTDIGALLQAQDFGALGIKANFIQNSSNAHLNIQQTEPTKRLVLTHTAFANGITIRNTGSVELDSKNGQDINLTAENAINLNSTGDATFSGGSKFDSTDGFSLLANGGLKTDSIQSSTGAGLIIEDSLGGIAIESSLGVTINNNGAAGVPIVLQALGAGSVISAITAGGTITITPSTGFTACTGTENKAGFNADNVIFTVGALQDLARSVAALWNATFAKGYIAA